MSTARLPLQPISVLSALLAYLGTIYGTQIAMASRPPFQLKRTVQTYNLGVGGASLVLLLLMLQEIVPSVSRVGIVNAIPQENAFGPNSLDWDTGFIHVYHHAATIFMSSTSLEGRNVFSWVVIAWKRSVTFLQVAQFVVVNSIGDQSIADDFLNLSSLVQCAETLSTSLRTKVEKLEIELATAKSRTAAADFAAREAKIRADEEEIRAYRDAMERDLEHSVRAMQDTAERHARDSPRRIKARKLARRLMTSSVPTSPRPQTNPPPSVLKSKIRHIHWTGASDSEIFYGQAWIDCSGSNKSRRNQDSSLSSSHFFPRVFHLVYSSSWNQNRSTMASGTPRFFSVSDNALRQPPPSTC
ncbi:hypothetical protein C8R44DRAFT_846640 [Mycena epipterygia]|nr:hypothetical protein C8R44DRAFT_846640 [Mycena epipterygia]